LALRADSFVVPKYTPPFIQRRNACVDADRALRTGTGGHHQRQPRCAGFIVGLLVDKSSAGNWVGLLPSKPLTKALARVRGRHVGLNVFSRANPKRPSRQAISSARCAREPRVETTGFSSEPKLAASTTASFNA